MKAIIRESSIPAGADVGATHPMDKQHGKPNRNKMGNHTITCNHCGKDQIIVHCGTNGNHQFEIAEVRQSLRQKVIEISEQRDNRPGGNTRDDLLFATGYAAACNNIRYAIEKELAE